MTDTVARHTTTWLAGAMALGAVAAVSSAWNTPHPALPDAEPATDPHKASFVIRYKNEESGYRINAVTVLPGDSLRIAVADSGREGFSVAAADGRVVRRTPRSWLWYPPSTPGLVPVTVARTGSPDTVLLNVFVMVPYDSLAGQLLNGYRIGDYPVIPLRGLPIYRPPRGFVEVTPENENTLVTPRYRLREFVAKQEGAYPKYVVLNERLLLKLEYLLEQVNAAGISATRFTIMSGYRTPYYNRRIGNVRYSRHLWGAAADLFIDESPRDGRMDDLNGDGSINVRDAELLLAIADAQVGKPAYRRFLGGGSAYRANSRHGPFLHVDVRERRARW